MGNNTLVSVCLIWSYSQETFSLSYLILALVMHNKYRASGEFILLARDTGADNMKSDCFHWLNKRSIHTLWFWDSRWPFAPWSRFTIHRLNQRRRKTSRTHSRVKPRRPSAQRVNTFQHDKSNQNYRVLNPAHCISTVCCTKCEVIGFQFNYQLKYSNIDTHVSWN